MNQNHFSSFTRAELAQKIDHTLLKPVLLKTELNQLCDEARTHGFKTVCIPPTWITEAIQLLKGSPVDVITVVGFPLGYSSTRSKVVETEQALLDGAKEIDMVLNLSFLKNRRLDEAQADIEAVVKTCNSGAFKILVKVIIETSYLDQSEKLIAAQLAEAAGAQFVKTSTGFATNVANAGATLEDIQLLRQTLKPETKIKASGGIRDFESAVQLLRAGADRLGTSAGVAILKGLKSESGY